MAKKKKETKASDRVDTSNIEGLRAEILEQPIVDTLELNYMPYAMSVIVSRAIPEIDGFKPSHRKLLYTMYKMGLLTGARSKSANIVGRTMQLNPHGDAAIYETMVRLAKGHEALLVPFIDSKGNFGKVYSRDMAYAASRYTEAKLAPICAELFKDIDNDIDLINWYMGLRTGSFIMSDEGGAGGQHTASEDDINAGAAYVDTAGNVFDETFESLTHKGGVRYDQLNATYRKYEKGMLRPDGSVGFATPSGRVELAPTTFAVWQLSTTPVHVEPATGPISTPEMMEEYPLILTCGGRSYEWFHSEHRQLPTMREFHPLPLVTINPKTAEKYGIKDGEWVWIENDRGRLRQIAKISEEVNEKTVHAEHGWWFPEEEAAKPSMFGAFNSNVNNLTRDFQTGEGGIGSSIKAMICKIYPYKEGDEMPNEVVFEKGGFHEIIPGEA